MYYWKISWFSIQTTPLWRKNGDQIYYKLNGSHWKFNDTVVVVYMLLWEIIVKNFVIRDLYITRLSILKKV